MGGKRRKRNPANEDIDDTQNQSGNSSSNKLERTLPSTIQLKTIEEKFEKNEMPTQNELFLYCNWLTGENKRLTQEVSLCKETSANNEAELKVVKEEILKFQDNIKTIESNQEANEALVSHYNELQIENEQLKTDVIQTQAHATKLTVRISNVPYHREAEDGTETPELSKQQLHRCVL